MSARLAMLLPLLGCLAVWSAPTTARADEESCLDCHGHAGLARFTAEGGVESYFVDDEAFAHAAHGAVRCGECHRDVERIPHGKTKTPDCTSECHIQEPSTGRPFSHKRVAEYVEQSVHGLGSQSSGEKLPDDLPTCVTCHRNDPVRVGFEFRNVPDGAAQDVLSRCRDCHPKPEFAERYYAHFAARLRPKVPPLDLVRLCTGCHEDEARMARHGLEVTSTLRDTYHWKLVLMGDGNAPDCLSCHVPTGASAHAIRHKDDEQSSVNLANRRVTCANQGGVQACHPGATAAFASGAVHASGAKARIYEQLQEGLGKDRFEAALAESASQEVTRQVLFEHEVLDTIRFVYKLLIAMVVGGMFVHQLLDFIRLSFARFFDRRQKLGAGREA